MSGAVGLTANNSLSHHAVTLPSATAASAPTGTSLSTQRFPINVKASISPRPLHCTKPFFEKM
jgi:hypothetical protein